MIEFRIDGETELAEALKGLPVKLSKEAAFEAMVIGLQPMVDAAQAYCPVETGSLKQSIGLRIVRYQKGMLTMGIVGPRRGFGKDGREPANYGHLVEFGHRINRRGNKTLRKGGKASGVVPPQPFLRPAWEATKEKVRDTIGDEFGMRVESMAKQRHSR